VKMSSNIQNATLPLPVMSLQPLQQPPSSAPQVTFRWRDIGYRGVAEWMTSEDDFFIIRRFATLNTRVLLAKQAEISQLERMLDDIDNPALNIDNSTYLDDKQQSGRRALIERL
jgi:hypothetical protein